MNNVTNQRRYPVESCNSLSPKIISTGLLREFGDKNYNWLASPRLQLILVLTIFLRQGFHFILKHFGLPVLTSQIIAGLLLSEAVLPKQWSDVLMLSTLTAFGCTFFVFICGVEMDISMLTREGSKACYLALMSILLPMIYTVSGIVIISNSHRESTSIFYISPMFYVLFQSFIASSQT